MFALSQSTCANDFIHLERYLPPSSEFILVASTARIGKTAAIDICFRTLAPDIEVHTKSVCCWHHIMKFIVGLRQPVLSWQSIAL